MLAAPAILGGRHVLCGAETGTYMCECYIHLPSDYQGGGAPLDSATSWVSVVHMLKYRFLPSLLFVCSSKSQAQEKH